MENKAKKKNVAQTVRELVLDAVLECGCELWDVEYVKDPTGWNLIIYIDKEEGISLTDCEMVNDAVEPILDEHDPIPDSYCLEISSPGLERELKTYDHIERFLGNDVNIRLYSPLCGSKSLSARLISCDRSADTVKILYSGNEHEIDRKAIAKIYLVAEF